MKKEELKLEKLLYVHPSIVVIRICHENVICASVTPGNQSTEENWEAEEELDGGEIEI